MQNKDFNKIDIIKQIIDSNELFANYVLKKWKVNKLSAVHNNYDFILESNDYNRWMLFRISDFNRYQKVVIWVNLLDFPKPTNFDLQTYFYANLKNRNIEKQLSFKSTGECDFIERLRTVLYYIINNLDENGKSVLEGRYWIDSPFNWHEYK